MHYYQPGKSNFYELMFLNTQILKLSQLSLILILLTVLFFAFMPGPVTPAFVVNHDKAFHFLVFFALSLLLTFAMPKIRHRFHVVSLFLFAIAIELIQLLFVHRGYSLMDILYDVSGITSFYLLIFLYRMNFHAKSHKQNQ